MHIPDGMLSTPVAAASGVASAGFVAYAVSWVKKNLTEQRTVLMSVTSALVFALQMLNFPIAPGISGHFAGGAAAAILLGPWPAVIVMTTVLLVQAFLFADGGVVALGANVLNLAVLGPLLAYAVTRAGALLRTGGRTRLVVCFAAAWVAVVASSLAVGVEVWLSGRAPLVPALVTLGGWHALVGVGEGVITAGLVAFVERVRPDVLPDATSDARSTTSVAGALALVATAAVALSWVASSRPDALEFVAASAGFASDAPVLGSPLAEYLVPGVANEAIAGVLAGLVGLVVSAGLLFAAARALGSRRAEAHRAELHRHGHEHPSEPVHEHPHHHPADSGHDHAHTLAFERFTYIVSPVHSMDPRSKVVATLAFVLGVVLSGPAHAVEFVFAALLLVGVMLLARIPPSAVLRRSLWVLVPAATLALFAPFVDGGWQLAWTIVSKAWLSALAVLVLSATTRPPRLLAGLRRLGLPGVFVETLTFLHRFALVLSEQIVSMRRAVASRGPGVAGFSLVRLYGNLAGNLFLRTYERGERIHASMLSRGFTGALPTTESLSLTATDALLVAAAVMSAAALILY